MERQIDNHNIRSEYVRNYVDITYFIQWLYVCTLDFPHYHVVKPLLV